MSFTVNAKIFFVVKNTNAMFIFCYISINYKIMSFKVLNIKLWF